MLYEVITLYSFKTSVCRRCARLPSTQPLKQLHRPRLIRRAPLQVVLAVAIRTANIGNHDGHAEFLQPHLVGAAEGRPRLAFRTSYNFV